MTTRSAAEQNAKSTGRRYGSSAAQHDMYGTAGQPAPVPTETQARQALGADYDLTPKDRRPALVAAYVTGWLEAQKLVEPPVGIQEIAAKLGVERATVDQWRQRGILPDPDWPVGGRPAWAWSTIWRWAEKTSRIGGN